MTVCVPNIFRFNSWMSHNLYDHPCSVPPTPSLSSGRVQFCFPCPCFFPAKVNWIWHWHWLMMWAEWLLQLHPHDLDHLRRRRGTVPVPGPGRPGGDTGHRSGPGFFEGGSTGHRTGQGFFVGKKIPGQTGPVHHGHPVDSPMRFSNFFCFNRTSKIGDVEVVTRIFSGFVKSPDSNILIPMSYSVIDELCNNNMLIAK